MKVCGYLSSTKQRINKVIAFDLWQTSDEEKTILKKKKNGEKKCVSVAKGCSDENQESLCGFCVPPTQQQHRLAMKHIKR